MTNLVVDKADVARMLDGREYGFDTKDDIKHVWKTLKSAGIVVVFGASDDLMAFRGAINDEVDCYGGGDAHLNSGGLFNATCDNDDCPHEKALKDGCTKITSKWCEDGFSWTYTTEIPHSTFIIKEDGENFCRGIVFALADVPAGRTA